MLGVVDEELLEDRLVHQAAGVLVGFEVGGVEVADEFERRLEVGLDGLELELGGGEALLDSFELAGDTVLFGLEQVEGDGADVVGFEQLGAFVEELALPPQEPLTVGDLVFAEGGDLFEDGLLGLEAQVTVELDVGVVAFDRLFDFLDQQGSLAAAFRGRAAGRCRRSRGRRGRYGLWRCRRSAVSRRYRTRSSL